MVLRGQGERITDRRVTVLVVVLIFQQGPGAERDISKMDKTDLRVTLPNL